MPNMMLQDYCSTAYRSLGAVACRAEYYPFEYGKPRSVFAYRFFNADANEVAWYCPDTGVFHMFTKPRVWPYHAVYALPEVSHKPLSPENEARLAEILRGMPR